MYLAFFLLGWVGFLVGGSDFRGWIESGFCCLWCWWRGFAPFGLCWPRRSDRKLRDFGILELMDVGFLSPWDRPQGGRAVKISLPLMMMKSLGGGGCLGILVLTCLGMWALVSLF